MKILYCSLFRTLSWKRHSGSDVVAMLNEMIFQHGIQPDIQTFTGLIYYFGRKYKDLKAVKYLSAMVGQCDLERDVYFFQILIRAYVWCHKPGDAYRVFEEMRKSNMMPDFATRNVLCKGLKMENKLNEIAAIKSTLDHDAVLPLTWHGYIFKECHIRAQGKMNGSVWRATTLQKRSSKKKPPLLLVGRAYLKTYIDAAYIDEAPATTVDTYVRKSRLLQSLKQALHHPHSTNDDNNTAPLITLLSDPLLKDDPTVLAQALRSSPSADSAISLIETLDQHVPQFSLSRYSLHAFARVLAESGRAIDLHNLIEATIAGVIPGLRLISGDWYSTDLMELARHYYALGDLGSLLDFWRQLVRGFHGKLPCTESFNMVMDLYGRDGNHSEAVKIFHALVREKRIPNTRTYSIMIEHLASAGKFESAKQVFDILPRMRIKRTARQYSVLLRGFAEMESFDVVGSLICEMRLDGILPGQSTRLALQSMMDSGLVEDVDALVRQLLPDGTSGSLEDIDFGFTSSRSESEKDDDEDKSFELKPTQPRMEVEPRFFQDAFWNLNPDMEFAIEGLDFEWTTPLVCKVIRNLRRIDRAWNFFQWLEKSKPGDGSGIMFTQSRQ
ncbi:hypothetical protein RJ640_023952 [Escallonia rubra]|uniref:Pentatricopeptide repeat-containing protein n=1 Tax=Escallonia rubra TaxID=112253 RepID=A0AA88UW54_9ASTE|nr:hypothetical protein RJ640_023952 [Escallonia rubra]